MAAPRGCASAIRRSLAPPSWTGRYDRPRRRSAPAISLGDLDHELRRLIEACFDAWRQIEGRAIRRAIEGVTDFRVRKSIRLIEEGPGADVELDAVARESGLSRPHFYKLFRTQTGLTPNLFLNTILMERALDRLVRSVVPVAEIGYDLGFSSQSGFTKFFSANVGMAPSDYRRVALVLRIAGKLHLPRRLGRAATGNGLTRRSKHTDDQIGSKRAARMSGDSGPRKRRVGLGGSVEFMGNSISMSWTGDSGLVASG